MREDKSKLEAERKGAIAGSRKTVKCADERR